MRRKWQLNHLLTRVWRRICESVLLVPIARLALLNRYSRKRITTHSGPVVSLTTYGKRLRTVYLTIESIACGSVLPSRIVLWLDERAAYDHPPATLRRLQTRGLELRLCRNYGPHTKYYPYVESQDLFDVPMVIADDDILYPRWWLQALVESSEQYPDTVNCCVAKTVELDEGGIARYDAWKIAASTQPSPRNIAHGVNGVIFPVPYMMALKEAGDGFVSCCPKADDIWLHVQAIRAGYKIRQILPSARRFPAIPGTQEGGLWVYNNSVGNDQQVKATYSAEDIEILRGDRDLPQLSERRLSGVLKQREDGGSLIGP
jgi:hypothetical protein